MVAPKRKNGTGTLRADIIRGKVSGGAVGMGILSCTIRNRLGQRTAFQGSLVGASDGKFVPVPGVVLVLVTDGKAIGAVGISGDTSDKDEFCAIQGIKAAGLASAPSEPDESWKASSL